MVSPLRNWSTETGSFSRRRVGKRKRPREWRLKTSALPARDSKTVVRGDQEVGHWERPQAGLYVHQFGQRQQQRLGANQLGGLVLAASCWQCTVKHHTDIINFACMTWNFVRIPASLSALCTNFERRKEKFNPRSPVSAPGNKSFRQIWFSFYAEKNYLFVGKIFEHI